MARRDRARTATRPSIWLALENCETSSGLARTRSSICVDRASFRNRGLRLATDTSTCEVEGYLVGRRQARAAAIAKDLAEKLAHLPRDQVDEIMRMMTSGRPLGGEWAAPTDPEAST
jgi:hypothetical protein